MFVLSKRSIFIVLMVVSGLTTATCTEPTKRCAVLDSNEKLSLIVENQSQTVIVVPESSCDVVRFAGTELQAFMEQSFGSKVPVVTSPDDLKTSIILGDNDFSHEAEISLAELPQDGFIIQAVGKRIYILGKDSRDVNPEKNLKQGAWGQYFERGTLFGVYDFLERFLGARFYFPGEIGTVIPEHKELTIPAMTIVELPDYQVRKFSWYDGQWYEGNDRDEYVHPEKNLNYYRLRLETSYLPNCHGLARLDYLNRFGKTNPEYFAVMSNGKRHNNPGLPHPGQLCYNSEIREQIFKDAKAFLTGQSAEEAGILTERYGYCWDQSGFQPGYFNIMPQDSFYPCTCPKCVPFFSKGSQESSDFVWTFVREVALRLKEDKIPGYVTMMAYSPYRDIPDVEIPDNVLVMVAEHGPWGIDNKEAQDKDNQEIKEWVEKTGRKTWLWNYANKWGKLEIPGIPQVTPQATGQYYQEQKPYIFGAYMESETDKYIFNALNYYIFSKVCWNNDIDLASVLDEYYKSMFGPAAKVMKRIDERFEELWLGKIGGRVVDSPLGPMASPPSEYELWEKIYSADEVETLTGYFEQAEKLASSDKKFLQRVMFFREHFLDSVRDTRGKYFQSKNELADLTFYAKPVPSGASIKLDGKLDETVWAESTKLYLHPYKGNPEGAKVVHTIVYALKDENYLYFAFTCEEPKITNMVYAQRENDSKDIWRDSSIEIFLNPSGDRKNYYQFMINVLGSTSDIKAQRIGMDQVYDWDWNSEATVKTAMSDQDWSVEIAIPLKNLGLLQEKGFPANFNRNRILDEGKDYVTLYTWSPFLKHGFHDLENFGNVVFAEVEDTSILDNGDFTAVPAQYLLGKWYAPRDNEIKSGQSWLLDQSTFIKGGQSLKLVNGPSAPTISVTHYLPQLKPDTKYLLTFYIKTENLTPQKSGAAGAGVNVNDEKNRWFPGNWFLGSMPWTKQGFEFTTGPHTNKDYQSYMRLYIIGADGTAWFDDVRLREVK